MGIKSFFKKVWGGIKKGVGVVKNGIGKAVEFVGKIAKPVVNIAKPILGGLSMLPGKIGMIGKVGSAAAGVAKEIIDKIPNQGAKDKLNQIVDKGVGIVQQGQEKAQQVASKIQPYVQMGQQVVDKIPHMTTQLQQRFGGGLTSVLKAPSNNM